MGTSTDEGLEIFSSLKNDKVHHILSVISSTSPTINRIKVFSMSRFGLVNNTIRKKAWLFMHGIDAKVQNIPIAESIISAHKEYHQVLMDVNRSLKRFPPGMDEVVRMAMQDQLVNLIIRVLIHNKYLHYYQGFHDVCVTFLLVLSEDEAYCLISKLANSHFIDFMAQTMEPTTQLLYLIYAIVELENPAIIKTLQQVSVEPFFALPWVITWFGHVLGDLTRILRVYDFFLASDPIMPLYLSAAIVLYRHEEVASTEVDFAQLHHMLTSLPKCLPIELLISDAMDLFLRHPPDKIISSGAFPRQLNLRLTNIGSEILRLKKGPIGDSIDTRTRAIYKQSWSVVTYLNSTVSRYQQWSKKMVGVAILVALLSVLIRLIFTRLL